MEQVLRSLTVFKGRGVVTSWTVFSLAGGEVIGSQHHQPSGSTQCGVYTFVGNTQLLLPHGGGFCIC